MNTSTSIYWDQMPWDILPKSATVDFALVLAGIKPAFRSKLLDLTQKDRLVRVVEDQKRSIIIESDGYFVVASGIPMAQTILNIDKASFPHAKALGQLLGYPLCCCQQIEYIQENAIDAYAQQFHKQNLSVENRFLDISLYTVGTALLSHVPCSLGCQASLEKAAQFKDFIKKQKDSSSFSVWSDPIRQYYDF